MELRLPLEMSPGREAACPAVFGTWGFFPNDARKNCPFVLTSFTGWSSERCPGIGFLSRRDREIGVLRNVEPPTRPRLECLRPAPRGSDQGDLLVDWLAGAARVLRSEIRERWGRLALLSLAGVVAYQALLLAPFARYGFFPNYFTVHNAPAAILEDVRMRPPLAELWRLVTDEPVYEFGVRDRFGFIALQFVATPHSLFTMLVLPPLVALSLLLLARSLAVLRQRGGVALPVAEIGR